MKKFSFLLLTLLLVLIIPLTVIAANFIGNHNSYKFHYSGCRYVKQMNENNKVPFDSRDEAIDAGYIPCKVCRP